MAYEDALPIEDCNHGDIDNKDLTGLPVNSVEDRDSRLHLNSASHTQTVLYDRCPAGKESLTVPGVEEDDDMEKLSQM